MRLAPLTVLVGENSTGKSSFLAATRLARDAAFGGEELDFNEDPFRLGAYAQIAHAGGQRDRENGFALGVRLDVDGASEVEFLAEFLKAEVQPVVLRKLIRVGNDEIVFNREQISWNPKNITLNSIGTAHLVEVFGYFENVSGKTDFWRQVQEMVFAIPPAERVRPYAFAPVRTKPRRTYDPIRETPDPEGEHIPMVLARTFRTDKAQWKTLKKALDRFGKASGLFQSVEVKAKGESDSDPFQIEFQISGLPANMIDVGYGVSQILPILVEALSSPERQTFLMQQPEVHLHPRAQAELGTFLATLAKDAKKQFLVETHSDYLIDRIRMNVRDKKGLTPEDISILYFERQENEVVIHQLSLDEQGNLLGAPGSHGQFFMEEERRFLGL